MKTALTFIGGAITGAAAFYFFGMEGRCCGIVARAAADKLKGVFSA